MKHKLQNLLKHNWRTLLLLLTLITTSQGLWAWSVSGDVYLYNVNDWNTPIGFGYDCNDGYKSWTMTHLGNGVYKCTPDSRSDISKSRFYGNGSEYNNIYKDFNSDGNRCFYPNDGGQWLPPVWSFSLKDNGTTKYGGSGTSDDPYHVKPGATVKVCENSSGHIGGIRYNWKSTGDWSSIGTSNSDQFTLSSGEVTSYGRAYSEWGGNTCTYPCEAKLYYKADVYNAHVYAYYQNGGSYSKGTTGGNVKINSGETGEDKNADVYGSVTVTATVASGYIFKGWYNNSSGTGDATSTDASYTFTISSNKILYAIFDKDDSAIFEEGQVVWLDIRTSGTEAGWGQESGETFYVRIDDSDSYRRAMTKVAGNGTNSRSSVWIYKITNADAELNKSSLKFQRAKDNNYWNKSIELTASDVKSGNNGVYITNGNWDNAGTKYNANSLTSVSNPTLTMKNSAGSSTITECQAGDEVNFSSTVPTISVNNTSKGSLTTPLYIYSFTEGSYSSGQQTSNLYSWTTTVVNAGSGTASVKVSFAIDGSNTSSRTIDSGYEKTGSTSFTVNSACVDPNIVTNLDPSTSWSKCGNAEGRQLSITASGGSGTLTYQWFRNTTNTLTDGVADLTGATAVTDMVEGGNTYSPSASDYGKFYYCCVVRSGGACSANKATSVYTGEIEIKQTPTVKPSTITVKQYEPVRLQATNSSVNWSITTHPDGAAADEYYLYDETKNSAMFKGKTGSYTITATSTGSDCTSTSAITVENDPNTCN